MSATPRLQIDGLCVDRGGASVLHSISLAVAAGEILSVRGVNGSGKSTLLEAIAGLHRCRAGTIRMDGERIRGRTTEALVHRGVVLVPQDRYLFPRLTVREHLELAAFAAPQSEALENVDVMLDRWRLTSRADVRAGLLSGGEQRMVALARALRRTPILLLLDEPLAALSPERRDQVLVEMRHIADQGSAVVIVEHDMQRVSRVCDRAVTMVDGNLLRTIGAEVVA